MINLLKEIKIPRGKYYYSILLIVISSLIIYPPWIVVGKTQKTTTATGSTFKSISEKKTLNVSERTNSFDSLKEQLKRTDSLIKKNCSLLIIQQKQITKIKN